MKSTIKIDFNYDTNRPVIRIKSSFDTEDLRDGMLKNFLEQVNPEASLLHVRYSPPNLDGYNEIELTPVSAFFCGLEHSELLNLIELAKQRTGKDPMSILNEFQQRDQAPDAPGTTTIKYDPLITTALFSHASDWWDKIGEQERMFKLLAYKRAFGQDIDPNNADQVCQLYALEMKLQDKRLAQSSHEEVH